MKPILEYIISKNTKKYAIKATDATIKKIVKDELDRLGHDADLNHIDVSEVTDMNKLFSCAEKDYLGQQYNDLNPNINSWNVSKVEKMWCMFWKCKNFNKDLSQWNVGNVNHTGGMFAGCESFNQDLSGWDVSNVTNMNDMFYECKKFNQDLSRWNVKNVKKSYINMFYECPIKEEYKPKFN